MTLPDTTEAYNTKVALERVCAECNLPVASNQCEGCRQFFCDECMGQCLGCDADFHIPSCMAGHQCSDFGSGAEGRTNTSRDGYVKACGGLCVRTRSGVFSCVGSAFVARAMGAGYMASSPEVSTSYIRRVHACKLLGTRQYASKAIK